MASDRPSDIAGQRVEPLAPGLVNILGDEPGLQKLAALVPAAELQEKAAAVELFADRRSATVYGAAALSKIDAVAVWLLLQSKPLLASDWIGRHLGLVVLCPVTHFRVEHQQFVAAASRAAVAGDVRAHAIALARLSAHSAHSASVAKPILQ